MSLLQFDPIQTGRVAVRRWTARHVCVAARPLHVLLAEVLLVHIERRERRLNIWHSAMPNGGACRRERGPLVRSKKGIRWFVVAV